MNTRAESLNLPLSHGSSQTRPGWSSRLTFILAAAGSAVGLGNVWKFPYIAGEHGGGAFVLIYLAFVVLIGLPILIAEILIGRRGGGSPIHSFRSLARREGHSSGWTLVGWMGIGGAFLILSFYSVVAGWSLSYLWYALDGQIASHGVDATQLGQSLSALFTDLISSPTALIVGHSLIMAATMLIVANGIRGGLERAARWMVPGLFLLLIALVVFATATTGEFGTALAFMFRPNFSSLTSDAVLFALGHACFTLGVGMTAMMAYGSYLPKDVSITNASFTIAGLDTLVALSAGLAIFPFVFAQGLEPGSGHGLIFETLPIAFAQVPGGGVVATVFFLFLTVAALTSTISIMEPVVEYLEQRREWTRHKAASITGLGIWILGVAAALSFNVGANFKVFGKNVFDLLEYVSSNVLLPLGGLMIAVYAGHVLSRTALADELGIGQSSGFKLLRFSLRYLTPLGVGLVLLFNLL